MEVQNGYSWSDKNCAEFASPICQHSLSLSLISVELIGDSANCTESCGNVYASNSQGSFGPVCDDSWNDKDAAVVCRQLGYKDGTATVQSFFGRTSADFAMDNVNCAGT